VHTARPTEPNRGAIHHSPILAIDFHHLPQAIAKVDVDLPIVFGDADGERPFGSIKLGSRRQETNRILQRLGTGWLLGLSVKLTDEPIPKPRATEWPYFVMLIYQEARTTLTRRRVEEFRSFSESDQELGLSDVLLLARFSVRE